MNKKLSDILNFAYTQSDFYRNIYDEAGIDVSKISSDDDFQKFPIVSKNMIQKNRENIISEEYTRFPKSANLDIKRTSGSTGKYLKIYWDPKDEIRSMLPLWLVRNRKYKVSPDMNFCAFYSVMYKANSIVDIQEITQDKNYLGFSKLNLTYEKMVDCYKMLLDFKPEWMMLQPSIAYMMAEVVKKEQLPVIPSLKYLELSGEHLFESYRREIEKVFGIKSINMYGCNETNAIAIELEDGRLHVLTDNVYVEVLKDGKQVFDEEGDIYVTSLNNHAMPFIRYETGDRGILTRENNELILDVKTGRVSEFINMENGGKLNSYVIAGAMEYTNESMQNVIKQYQAIQTGINEFKMIMVINPKYNGWKAAVEESFLENIKKNQLKDSNWEFEWTDLICPEANTGKYRFFKNATMKK